MTEPYKNEAELTYERYENDREHSLEELLPEDDFREVNTETMQSISSKPEDTDVEFYTRSDMSPFLGNRQPVNGESFDPAAADEVLEDETELEDVPDADAIQKDSPVDPVATIEDMHGTDLINGFDGDETE